MPSNVQENKIMLIIREEISKLLKKDSSAWVLFYYIPYPFGFVIM
jgi:hypothetical protein